MITTDLRPLDVVTGIAPDAVARLLTQSPDFVFERLDPHSRHPVQTHLGFAADVQQIAEGTADSIFASLRSSLPAQAPHNGVVPQGATGGVMALIGYEPLAAQSRHPEEPTPAAILLRAGTLVTLDHGSGKAWIRSEGGDAPESILDALRGKGSIDLAQAPAQPLEWTPAITEEAFDAVARLAQSDMAPGRPLEGAVLSVRLTAPGHRDPVRSYSKLREINPSTYMFLLQTSEIQAWGATSLGLARMQSGTYLAETDGATRPYEDESFVWAPTAKEIAEYDVVVGALRDALGPLTDAEGLTFASEMEERRFFKLAHLFAAFTGRLAAGRDAADLVGALSPHGAAVGYHRQPALDAIEAAETTPRGPFAGTVAFFGSDGSVDSCAFTRSMWQTAQGLFVHAGAKVVPDSIPVEEYRECVLKTRALRECAEL